MAADFVPFLQTLGARPAAPTSTAFTPVGTPVAKTPAAHSHAPSEVRVELKREGDRVAQIRIHCRCGEVIELNCDYGL